MKLEYLNDEKSFHLRVQTGGGGFDSEAWRQHGSGFTGSEDKCKGASPMVASESDGPVAFAGHGKLTPEQDELKCLQRSL